MAKVAEEEREKLRQDKVTLDFDPLKGISKPAAKQTKEEIRQGLFQKWYSLKAEVGLLKVDTDGATVLVILILA